MLMESPAIYDAHMQYARSIRRYELHSRHQGPALPAPTIDKIVSQLNTLADIVRTDYLASSLRRWTILGTDYRIFRLDDALYGLAEGREGLISPLSTDPPADTPVMTTGLIPFTVFVEEKISSDEGIVQLIALGEAMYNTSRRALRNLGLQKVS